MTFLDQLHTGSQTVGIILAAMALFSLIEAAVPLHPRRERHRAHLGPNLALTFLTFATNVFFNAALVLTLASVESMRFGLLYLLELPSALAVAFSVVVLDFSYFVAHVAMHKVPSLWRFHRVHHCDPVVDVTTSIRQHPGEGVIRYAFTAAFAVAIGASPLSFAIFRGWSALHALFEHANIRLPLWLDRLLVLVVSTPHMHKVHHSRLASETDTNYGSLFSFFDRLFSTFTPSVRGLTVACGLDAYDDARTQTTLGLLALPFRRETASGKLSHHERQGSPSPSSLYTQAR